MSHRQRLCSPRSPTPTGAPHFSQVIVFHELGRQAVTANSDLLFFKTYKPHVELAFTTEGLK
jgi:hypothetical protein